MAATELKLGERQTRILQVLRDQGPLVVDGLLNRACPGTSREQALQSLRRLVEEGHVSLNKTRPTELAGALVTLSLPVSRGAIGGQFVADTRGVSR